jgi:GDP/UDP-N,N'-diacetylbacillosamine 2-epimerase (hydrolysing)
MIKKITIITGSRAEYGILKPVMNAIKTCDDLELSLIVTGMHLLYEYGYSIKEIEDDGFTIDAKVDMYLPGDSGAIKVKSLGFGLIGIVQAIEHINPDIILVLGDRSEALAGAIAGAYMQIPVAHIHGGDAVISGHIDESVRFAITKFAHIHFPATEQSAERIKKLGEENWRIHNVGSPALDSILNQKIIPRETLEKELQLDFAKEVILVIQHPVSSEIKFVDKHIRKTLDAIVEIGKQTIVLFPNNDVGSLKIIEAINQYSHYTNINIYRNIYHEIFLSLMNNVDVLIGNSSSGIIEAPSFQLPVVNIGTRQIGRVRSENVIDVGYDKNEIIEGIKKALYDKEFKKKVKNCKNTYGDGKTGKRIAKVLSEIKIDDKLLKKKITY